MGNQERPVRLSPRCEGPLDLLAVLVVVAGDAAQVAVGDPCKPSSFRDRELVSCFAESPDAVGIDPCIASVDAAFEFARPNPARAVRLDKRDEIGACRLSDGVGRSTSGRTGGRSSRRSERSR
jgi:hypothetical protein